MRPGSGLNCSLCGVPLKRIGKKVVRIKAEYIKAQVKVRQYVQHIYKCTKCGTSESSNEKDYFLSAVVLAPLLNHCIVSPSVMTEILYEKCFQGVPLNRPESMWRDLGIIITRKDMAYWTNRVCEKWLQPLVDFLHKTVIFHYTMLRNGDHAKELLAGWHGILVTDAYAGYEKVEDITRGLYWSHVRCKYIDSILLDGSGKEIPGSKGEQARKMIDQLFWIEKQIKELAPQERLKQR